VHWRTRFSDPDANVRHSAVEALRVAIDDAPAYGATTVRVVPGQVRDDATANKEQVWQRAHEAIAKVLPLAREKKVTIAIEVVWNGFLESPDELVAYVDEFADPRVAAYLDVSNVLKFGVPGATWIEKLGPRLAKLDFKGWSLEKGWVPIGEGDEDWPAIRSALGKIGYAGWATAEVRGGGRAHLADVKQRMDAVLGA
jgi:hexulose-6-phosphate isomerase